MVQTGVLVNGKVIEKEGIMPILSRRGLSLSSLPFSVILWLKPGEYFDTNLKKTKAK